MNIKLTFPRLFLILVAILLASTSLHSQSPAAPGEVQLLQALLEEVRALRKAMVESNAASIRSRMLLELWAEQRRQSIEMERQAEEIRARLELGRRDDGVDEQQLAQLRGECQALNDSQAKAKCNQEYESVLQSLDLKRKFLMEQAEGDRTRLNKLTGDINAIRQHHAATEQALTDLQRQLGIAR